MNEDTVQLPPSSSSRVPPKLVASSASFFAGANNVSIHGGSFVSSIARDAEVDAIGRGYREIPFGDIELRRELHNAAASDRGYISMYCGPQSKLYAARVQGRAVTVSIHRGREAERKWQEEVQSTHALRHPNFIQLYSTAMALGTYAAVYHGSLLTAAELLGTAQTPMLRVHHAINRSLQFWTAADGVEAICHSRVEEISFASLFNTSTRQFCFKISDPDTDAEEWHFPLVPSITKRLGHMAMVSDDTVQLVQDLPLSDIYRLCTGHLHSFSGLDPWTRLWTYDTWGSLAMDTQVVVTVRSKKSFKILAVAHLGISPLLLGTSRATPSWGGFNWIADRLVCLAGGWQRLHVLATMPPIRLFQLSCQNVATDVWTCQAEYFLHRSRARLRGNYSPVDCLHVEILVEPVREMCEAFLFVAPPATVFLPTTNLRGLAYWSLRPDGDERLTEANVRALRLPRIAITVEVLGLKFTETFYEGIRAVHEAHGFDPYGPDAAHHLGYPLFQFITPSNPRIPKVHFFDEDWEDGDQSISALFPFLDPELPFCSAKTAEPWWMETGHAILVMLACIALGELVRCVLT
ncbi:hypothetical protein MKEN_01120500 [Mycena kentingensis (nom. inval.)]|nr:hypothetical protein MKEN_01120500 [Mycena kentingensis (nom. inval.)]